MPESTHTAEVFDVLVLGSGEAGKYLSWSFGAEGKKVGLIERRYVGGSCPNIACLPSKNIVHSAKVAWYAQRLETFGMHKPPPGIDMGVVRERKRAMVKGLVDVHEKRFAANHVVFLHGEGEFVDHEGRGIGGSAGVMPALTLPAPGQVMQPPPRGAPETPRGASTAAWLSGL